MEDNAPGLTVGGAPDARITLSPRDRRNMEPKLTALVNCCDHAFSVFPLFPILLPTPMLVFP